MEREIDRNKLIAGVAAAVLVLDAQTGIPLALLDGTSLTRLRTGAASGLETQLLAHEDASVLAVIGTGRQARTQVEAILAVRPIHEIRLYSRSSAAPFAQEVEAKTDITVIVAQTAHEALSGADVVVTATNSSVPIIYAADLAPGAHINGIGSFTPVMREVASDVVVRSKIVVDHRESAWAEAGDLIIPRDEGLITEDDVYAEIGEIATGKLPGRTSADEITFFKSVGNAVQDAAVAGRILQVAQERQMGTLASL